MKKLVTELIESIDYTDQEKEKVSLLVNSIEMSTRIEPCQQHERNVCLKLFTKAMSKHMNRIIDVNSISLALNI